MKSCVDHGFSWQPGCIACDVSRPYDPTTTIRDDTITPRPAVDKIRDCFALFKNKWGYDARGGHTSVVMKPEYVEQLLAELGKHEQRQLLPAIAFGRNTDADAVFRFDGVPFRVRHAANPGVWICRNVDIPPATREDMFVAGRIRSAQHRKELSN